MSDVKSFEGTVESWIDGDIFLRNNGEVDWGYQDRLISLRGKKVKITIEEIE